MSKQHPTLFWWLGLAACLVFAVSPILIPVAVSMLYPDVLDESNSVLGTLPWAVFFTVPAGLVAAVVWTIYRSLVELRKVLVGYQVDLEIGPPENGTVLLDVPAEMAEEFWELVARSQNKFTWEDFDTTIMVAKSGCATRHNHEFVWDIVAPAIQGSKFTLVETVKELS